MRRSYLGPERSSCSTWFVLQTPINAILDLVPTVCKLAFQRVQLFGQVFVTSDAKEIGGSCCADIEILVENVWLLFRQFVESQKEYRFEFKTLNVFDIEHPYRSFIAFYLAVAAGENAYVFAFESHFEG